MVSSVVRGFEHGRAAARRGVLAAGGQPVLVNEDFPALATSPRNACLDAVDSCDVFLVIVGDRAGFIAPSGKPVVEEEYERATARDLPIIAFIQDGVHRDPEAERLAVRISDYVGGHFRATFTSLDELERQVAEAVGRVIMQLEMPVMSADVVAGRLVKPNDDQREVILRTVLAPLRHEEVIDVVKLGDREFHEALIDLGTAADVRLFSRWDRKAANLRHDSLIIEQAYGDTPPYRRAIVEVDSTGLLVIDSNVTGRTDDGDRFGLGGLQIAEGDVEAALAEHFAFAHALFEHVDPYQRQYAFRYNCALHGVQFRPLVRERRRSGSVPMSMRGDEPIVAHPAARQIGRAVLGAPAQEIARTLELFRRRMSE